MIDILLLIVLGVVTWCVAGEGAVGAALIFFSVLFAGLLAMNFFEPVAALLESISSNSSWVALCDITALLGLFGLLAFGLRAATEYYSPTYIQVPNLMHHIGRWGFGVMTGYLSMAIVLTALHTSPFPREFIGFKPERKNFLNFSAPDRQWLGFVQYVSETSLRKGESNIFDGPKYALPGQTNNTWPSFPIRYAYRRQVIASGVTTFSAPEAAPIAPPTPGGSGTRPNF
ncbi:MAG: CvpA family protein [Planctomycetaceae bacterium]